MTDKKTTKHELIGKTDFWIDSISGFTFYGTILKVDTKEDVDYLLVFNKQTCSQTTIRIKNKFPHLPY